MNQNTTELLQRLFQKDKRALARVMTYIDNRHSESLAIMSEILKKGGHAFRIGVTGPPGAGKSTLVDKLITQYRKLGKTVGVVAIDPSSPFSGGAVLGDRIRMQEHNADDGVFIRSLGSRGAHGGLSRATRDIVHLLDAFGHDVIIVETVGVGQTELDIMSVAHTTLVVLVPESGDTIQTMKAGLMEIADIFVVNKADREGADRIAMELQALSEMYSQDWQVPVLKAVALKNQGLKDLIETIEKHHAFQSQTQQSFKFLEETLKADCLAIFASEVQEKLLHLFKTNSKYQKIYESLLQKKLNTYEVVQKLLTSFHFD